MAKQEGVSVLALGLISNLAGRYVQRHELVVEEAAGNGTSELVVAQIAAEKRFGSVQFLGLVPFCRLARKTGTRTLAGGLCLFQ